MNNYVGRTVMREQGEDNKPIRFSKVIVVFSILTVLGFTIATFYMYWHTRYIPDSLIYSFYAFFGTEMLALAGIRKKETEQRNVFPPFMPFPDQSMPYYGVEEEENK